MKKDVGKRLTPEQIDWVEVIKGLEGRTTFGIYDLKKVLHKITGRTYNINSPLRNLVKKFIDSLGTVVTITRDGNNENVYTISSTEAAINALYRKRGTRTSTSATTARGITVSVTTKPSGTIPTKKKTTEEKVETPVAKKIPETPKISDEEKIKEALKGKRNYTPLEHAIYFLAIFVKHAETELSSRTVKTELNDLGINYSTFVTFTKEHVGKIYDALGFNKLTTKKIGRESAWVLTGNNDILDEYTRLAESYEKLTGNKTKNLDDYITTKAPEKEEVNRRYEALLEEAMKKKPHDPREESDHEIEWKKWLLISASKNYMGASRSVASLVSWISSSRHYQIDEEEAKNLCRELMVDTDEGFNFNPVTNNVTMNEKTWKRLSKFYSPSKHKENILVKLPLSQEAVKDCFKGLEFTLEDMTTSGMYFYYVKVNRSMECEIALKQLLRFIEITGKVYTENSWMINRVKGIIHEEDSKEKSKNTIILSLEH